METNVTLQLIERQRLQWLAMQEDLRIMMAVAEAIGDGEERKNQLRSDTARCIKAIEKLDKMLKELPTE